MPSVFICHASDDKAQAEPMQLALASAGFDVFYDQESLPPGGDYQARIRQAINTCDVFVFVASRASITPGRFTLTELKFARERWATPVNRVLPVVLGDLKPGDLPPYLQAATVLGASGNAAAEVRAAVELMWHNLKPRRGRALALALGTGAVAVAIALTVMRPSVPPDSRSATGGPPDVAKREPTSAEVPPSKALLPQSEVSAAPAPIKPAQDMTASTALKGELPPKSHFQLDSTDGVFCERNNVHKPFAPFFDSVDINIGACDGSDKFASRTYRVAWQPAKPRPVNFSERQGFDHCFVSNFSESIPKFVDDLQSSFEQLKTAIPCKISVYAMRQIRLSYVDIHNQSREVAFLQFYNRGNTRRFEIEQIGTSNLARSDQMESLAQEPDGRVLSSRLLEVAGQYRFPDVPR